MAHNTIPQPVQDLPSSGSNLLQHHDDVRSPLHIFYLNLQTHQQFLPKSVMFVLDHLAHLIAELIARVGIIGDFLKNM
uniref:Uncharacterized protein n=1 Tax=Rhinolophus ferrumequinum TaxID=59479 RepID=A0A671F200_RHIFE